MSSPWMRTMPMQYISEFHIHSQTVTHRSQIESSHWCRDLGLTKRGKEPGKTWPKRRRDHDKGEAPRNLKTSKNPPTCPCWAGDILAVLLSLSLSFPFPTTCTFWEERLSKLRWSYTWLNSLTFYKLLWMTALFSVLLLRSSPETKRLFLSNGPYDR